MNKTSSLFYCKSKDITKCKSVNKLNIKTNNTTSIQSKNKLDNSSNAATCKSKILNSTRNSSFFKLSTKTISTNPSNLNLNALTNFMSKNEFYFDLNKWQQTRSCKTPVSNKNMYLKHSVTISKLRFLELFGNKEFKDFNFNLNFFDQLSSFKNALKITQDVSNQMKSPKYVPEQ